MMQLQSIDSILYRDLLFVERRLQNRFIYCLQ